MKKFILKWGKGSVCEIRIIYKTLAIEAETGWQEQQNL